MLSLSTSSSESQKLLSFLQQIVNLAIPALEKTRDPDSHKEDALARLKILFDAIILSTATETSVAIAVKEVAPVFKLIPEVLNEPVQSLYKAIKQQPDKMKSLLAALNDLPSLLDVALINYLNFKPEILRKRQEEACQVINESKVFKEARRKIFGDVSASRSSTSIIFIFENAAFQMPRGWRYYMQQGWKPPQQFVDAVMSGGIVQVSVAIGTGEGTYEGEHVVTNALFEQIKKMSVHNESFYTPLEDGRPLYHVGYLFGIKTITGKEYDIDSHFYTEASDKDLRFIEATFAEYGKLYWRGKDVTCAFWDRLQAIDVIAGDGIVEKLSKINDELFIRELSYRPYRLQITLAPYKEDEKMSLNNPDIDNKLPSYAASSKASLIEELISVNCSKDETYISASVVEDITQVISAKKGEVYRRPNNEALIMFKKKMSKLSQQRFTLIPAPDQKFLYITKSNLILNNKFLMEKEVGEQGELIDQTLNRSHSYFEFATAKELEAAIDILTKPNCFIVNPLDIQVRGNTLYLMGPINRENLRSVKSKLPHQFASADSKADSKMVAAISPEPEINKEFLEKILRGFSHTKQRFLFRKIDEKTRQFAVIMPSVTTATGKIEAAIQVDLFKQAIFTLLEATDLKNECSGVTVQPLSIHDAKSITEATIISAEMNPNNMKKFILGLVPKENNYRLLEFARAAFVTAEKLNSETKSADTYIPYVPFLVPLAAIKEYQNNLLAKILSNHLQEAVLKGELERIKRLLALKAPPENALHIVVSSVTTIKSVPSSAASAATRASVAAVASASSSFSSAQPAISNSISDTAATLFSVSAHSASSTSSVSTGAVATVRKT